MAGNPKTVSGGSPERIPNGVPDAIPRRVSVGILRGTFKIISGTVLESTRPLPLSG